MGAKKQWTGRKKLRSFFLVAYVVIRRTAACRRGTTTYGFIQQEKRERIFKMYLAEVYNRFSKKFQAVYDLDGKTILVFDTPEASRRFLCINRGVISGFIIVPVPEGFLEQFQYRVIY